MWPQQAKTLPNLSESDKTLLLTLGLEVVYKRMADNHKFHIDVVQKVVQEVLARKQSLEQADQVLCSMRKAVECKYAHIMKQQFGDIFSIGMCQTVESNREEEEEEEVAGCS
jgi:hypothetical protein